MALDDFDSAVAYSFSAEVQGIQIKSITDVEGLKMETDIIELKCNNDQGQYIIRKLPGRDKPGEMVLTRHYDTGHGFTEWMGQVGLGKVSRKSGFVNLLDTEGRVLKRFEFLNGVAKSLELSALKAGSTDPITEKLTISFESLKVVP